MNDPSGGAHCGLDLLCGAACDWHPFYKDGRGKRKRVGNKMSYTADIWFNYSDLISVSFDSISPVRHEMYKRIFRSVSIGQIPISLRHASALLSPRVSPSKSPVLSLIKSHTHVHTVQSVVSATFWRGQKFLVTFIDSSCRYPRSWIRWIQFCKLIVRVISEDLLLGN